MTIQLDNLDVEGKKTLVIVTTVLMLVISHVTYALRLLAKRLTVVKFQSEDYMMGLALLFSEAGGALQLYGLTVGLGQHQLDVSPENTKKLSFSIWLIQRFQPFCLVFLKTSIILLYVRLFPTPKFIRYAWGIWIYTILWMIGALGASTFECTPVAYFWDKSIEGGHCVPNALKTISFTNGFLSFVGDCFILFMPVPMILHLHMNTRRKVALIAIFAVGIFVIITSIIRLIALFSIDIADLEFTQVEAGVWSYMEEAIGITCGNLPLLQPLFRHYFKHNDPSTATPIDEYGVGYYSNGHSRVTANSRISRSANSQSKIIAGRRNSYRRMSEDLVPALPRNKRDQSMPGSNESIEMYGHEVDGVLDKDGNAIHVQTDVTIENEDGTACDRALMMQSSIDPLRGSVMAPKKS